MDDLQETRRVLVALEPPTSIESKAALHWALTEFVKPGVDEVVLVHILKIPDLIATAMGRVPFSGANASIQAAYKQVEIEKAEVFLKDYQEVCRRKNVIAAFRTYWGEREAGLLAEVEATGATHLVMGTGSTRVKKGKFTSFLKGQSLTARVAKQARCSVFLVSNKAQLVNSHIYGGERGRPAGPGSVAAAGSGVLSLHSRTSSTSSIGPSTPPATPPLNHFSPFTPPLSHTSHHTPAIEVPSAPLLSPGPSTATTGPFSRSLSSLQSSFSSPRSPYQPVDHTQGFNGQSWGESRVPQTGRGPVLGSSAQMGGQVVWSREATGPHSTGGPVNGLTMHEHAVGLSTRGFTGPQNGFPGPHAWINADGQQLSGYDPDIREARHSAAAATMSTPSNYYSHIAIEPMQPPTPLRPQVSDDDGELARLRRQLQEEKEATARLQAAQAEYQRLIHAAETRAQSANSLAETERARARAAHLERELARQESALARQSEQEAREKELAAREAAEKERQERVAERQQAAEQLKALLERQKQQRQYRTYTYPELTAATQNFSPSKRLGEGGFGEVYLGRLEHMPAAIKVLNPEGLQGPDEFQREVEILSALRHPHIVMLMGCCPERGCLVYEYCANGSLEDRLARKGDSAPLPWYTRIRIAFEIATALLFMHKSRPCVIHKDLKPSNILLDQNLTSKLGDVGIASVAPELAAATFTGVIQRRGVSGAMRTSMFDSNPQGTPLYIDPEYQQQGTFNQKSDVYAFGICLLQLLVNRPPLGIVGFVEDAFEEGGIMTRVDSSAGSWPEEVASKVAILGLRCAQIRRRDRPDLETEVLPDLEAVRAVAMEAAAREASRGDNRGATGDEDVVPSIFLCPISHDIMEDPVLAADGNTYERSEITEWLRRKRTSPLTNVALENTCLTPNLVIRSAIKEWQEGTRRDATRGLTGQGFRRG